MTKTELKSEFYNLLSPLVSEGIEVQGSDSDIVSRTPLITYKLLDKAVLIHQGHVDRFATYLFNVKIYANSSVECTTISDKIDELLLPIGFIETQLLDKFDNVSNKFTLMSVYAISIDENGIAYNIA